MSIDYSPKESKDKGAHHQDTYAKDETFLSEAFNPLLPNHTAIRNLQRTIGNQAVERLIIHNRLIQRKMRAHIEPSMAKFGAEEERLNTAHLATQIMRSLGSPKVIQRDGGMTSADAPMSAVAPSNTTQTPSVSPEVAHRLAFAATVLRAVPRLSESKKKDLDRLAGASNLVNIINERDTLAQNLEYERALLRDSTQLAPGESLPGGVALSAEQVETLATQLDQKNAFVRDALAANGISDEATFHRLIDDFPQQWINRGKQIAYTILNQNQSMVLQEKERYQSNVCSPDVEGLLNADRELLALTQQIDSLRISINTAQAWLPSGGADMPNLPPNMGSIAYDIQHLPQHRQSLTEKTALLDRKMRTHALKFPILWSRDYVPGCLSQVSSEEMARLTGQWSQDILSNIATTKSNIADDTIKVWEMPEVYSATFQDLGISESSFLGTIVRQYIQGKISDASSLGIARAALAITAGLIATFASGGIALVAFGVSAGLGAWQLIDDVNSFRAESSAEQVALDDPIIADISANEPNLLPMVLDVIGLGLDIGGVVGVLRAPARALSASGDIAQFTSKARQLVEAGELSEEAAEELVAKATRRACIADDGMRNRLFERSTTTADPTQPAGTGGTDPFGNITYSTAGSATDQKLALYHEQVHSFLSPKFKYLRNFRARLAMAGYSRSALLQYIEEALAETVAQLRVNGLRGLRQGIRFPIDNPYTITRGGLKIRITFKHVVTEAAIGTIAYGGVTYGVYVAVSKAMESENSDEDR